MHAVFELEEVSSRPPLACQPGLIRISCTEEKRILIYCNILHASAVRQQRSKICPVVTDCLLCPQNLPKAAQNNHSAGQIAVEASRSCGAVARATTLGVEFRAFTFGRDADPVVNCSHNGIMVRTKSHIPLPKAARRSGYAGCGFIAGKRAPRRCAPTKAERRGRRESPIGQAYGGLWRIPISL